jgi:biotin carboxylase
MERSMAQVRAMGYALVVVTDGDTSRLSMEGVQVLQANPGDAQGILQRLRERAEIGGGVPFGIAGVLSLGYDNPETVAELAEALGCAGLPLPIARRCNRKDLRLRHLQACGLYTPFFHVASTCGEALDGLAGLLAQGAPAMVKPVDATASRGVLLVREMSEAADRVQQAFAHSRSGRVVVESFLEGSEHTVVGFLAEGHFAISGFADRAYHQKWRFEPHVFESGDTLPTALAPAMKQEVCRVVERGVRALELDAAFFNTDVLVTPSGQVVLLEVTPRLTGARIATEVMRLATGVDPLPNVVRLATGQPLRWDELQPTRSRCVVQRFRPCEAGVVDTVAPLQVPPLLYDVFWCRSLSSGMVLPPYRSADDVLAGVIAEGDSLEEAERVAEAALRHLPITMAPLAT